MQNWQESHQFASPRSKNATINCVELTFENGREEVIPAAFFWREATEISYSGHRHHDDTDVSGGRVEIGNAFDFELTLGSPDENEQDTTWTQPPGLLVLVEAPFCRQSHKIATNKA